MIYGFDTGEPDAATAALLVYAVYRSRDRRRFRVTPDLWAQAERFVKAAAKRAETLPRFVEALKPRFCADTLNPRAMATVSADGVLRLEGDGREFLTAVLARVRDRDVIDRLYRETAFVVLLVRDRLERERPAEKTIEAALDAEEVPV